MKDLEKQLEELQEQAQQVISKINDKKARQKIKCSACDKYHAIQSLTAIQTHFYIEPHGCTDGDYWKEGEMQFICPETNVINRLLFDNYDVPWEERNKYENNPEKQFKHNYEGLFKEVQEVHEKTTQGKWVNNFYVDRNRKKFGLVERRDKAKNR
jgi:hypothetical protein